MMRRDAARLKARAEEKRRRRELQDIWKKIAELIAGGLTEANAVASIAAQRHTHRGANSALARLGSQEPDNRPALVPRSRNHVPRRPWLHQQRDRLPSGCQSVERRLLARKICFTHHFKKMRRR